MVSVVIVMVLWSMLMLTSFKTSCGIFAGSIKSGPCPDTKTMLIFFVLLFLVITLCKLELKHAACIVQILMV